MFRAEGLHITLIVVVAFVSWRVPPARAVIIIVDFGGGSNTDEVDGKDVCFAISIENLKF